MAGVRQIPADEYESMKKSYGLTDDQMKSMIGVEPISTRWADGFGDERPKEDAHEQNRQRHAELVNEITSRLKNSDEKTVAEAGAENVSGGPVSEKSVFERAAESFSSVNAAPMAPRAPSAPTTEATPAFEPVDAPVFEPVAEENFAPTFEAQSVPSFEMPADDMSAPVPDFSMPDAPVSGVEPEATPAFEPVAEEAVPPTFEAQSVPSFEMPAEDMSAPVPDFSMPEAPVSEVEPEATPSFEAVSEPVAELEPEFQEAAPIAEEMLESATVESVSTTQETAVLHQESTTIIESGAESEVYSESSNNSVNFTTSRDEMFRIGTRNLTEIMATEQSKLLKQADFSRE